jgi:hypothetical protein
MAGNIILFQIAFSVDTRQAELSPLEQVAVVLLEPFDALTIRIAPVHLGERIAAQMIFSVLLYSIALWLLVSVSAWLRHRA